ncbi:MAG: AAA family ATPase [Candidatus Falkowbacteria bacterium]
MKKDQFIFIIRGKTGAGKTSLVKKIIENFKFKKITLDDIKKTKEKKENVFEKAGMMANGILKRNHNIIVEEAFLKKNHIKLFFRMIKQIEKYRIQYILLECSEDVAIKRKVNLKPERVQHKYKRKTEKIDSKNELIINTENKNAEEVFNEILKANII